MNFIESALKYKQVTLTVLFLFFIAGIYSLLEMPRREDPKITIRQALVIAYYPGASSTQVEDQVTSRLEEYLFKFEEVKRRKTVSSSEDGKVVITVELNDHVKNPDVFWSKLRHELMVARQVDFPEGVIGPFVNSDFGDTEAMILGISGKNVPYSQLKHYAQQLEEQLRSLPSVSKVKRSGDLEEQILVELNTVKIAQLGVHQTDILKIIQSQNNVYPTGKVDVDDFTIPLYTKGFYETQEELANQIVGASNTGSVVRLKDIATITRTYAEPASRIRINEQDGLIISIQMLAGNNIVKFGEAVQEKIAEFRQNIPSNIEITTIADQPNVVNKNVSQFLREFMLAIIAVVVVILLMLPFRIAVVAAMAIPMTISFTLALMNIFGIELHQVSLASLIVVLGLVVDDAIVVADNYVELLDKGMKRWEAAWRSASELVVPIFVATATIIFAFMPMVMLTGPVGEFIEALPLTVTISLSASFIIAMVFTPLLCFTFIKKGLHSGDNGGKKKKAGLLNLMQTGYDRLLEKCIAYPKTTILLSVIPVFLALLIYFFGIRQEFFPHAERNQFAIELWMPTGTNLETAEKATRKLEALLRDDKRVVSYTSFIGTSAPRFYYNFSPEFPVPHYAQIVVNTTGNEITQELAAELHEKVETAVPEGSPQVRLMQQGQPLKAHVEVQIRGADIDKLKSIGKEVDSIIQAQKGSIHVHNDFREDYYGLDIRLKPEASRLGFTTEVVAKSIYAGFAGAPVTTIREGKNAVKVMLKLEKDQRQSVTDIEKLYLTSPVTNAKVPLSQVAELVPVWKTGRVVHRNGMRLLTVQSETTGEIVPSQLLKKIQPAIASLKLPNGYFITYGGEDANQKETLGGMIIALCISLLLIFLILMFQFRNLREAGIIMLTIPLSLFGAMLGLFVTGNSFGFTAFVGLISLSGVVVRNAIILIDHIHELTNKHGMDIAQATIESGKRRLRPIFLTAMAAAIGVLPMIVSGSPMWSPLASVIAFGVLWGMIIALLTVPVFYLLWIVPGKKKISSSPKNEA